MQTVLVIAYDRVDNLIAWEAAWEKMNTTDCKLIFAITGNIDWKSKHEILRYPNIGMDIGCLQRFIQSREDYDRLFWVPDDFLPLDKELLQKYSTADVVGTFWSTTISPHIRSGGVSITKQVAKFLQFPTNLLVDRLNGKRNCYFFEHSLYNFYNQVRAKFSVKMVDGTTPPNSPEWSKVPQKYLLDSEGKIYMCPF